MNVRMLANSLQLPDGLGLTVRDLEALDLDTDEGKLFELELFYGVLTVTGTPNVQHQRVSGELLVALHAHVKARQLGELLASPIGLVLADDVFLQPDILYVASSGSADVGDQYISGPPDLCVEILSPSTRRRDLGIKREIYEAFGVREYWIVDPDAGRIERHDLRDGKLVLAATFERADTLTSSVLPDVEIDLGPVFVD